MAHDNITANLIGKLSIGDLGFRVGDKFTYDYDFGDDWEHEIRVEKIEEFSAKYTVPTCTEGQRACPPEDCGGPYSYDDAVTDQSIWIRETYWDILNCIAEGKLPEIDTDEVPYWYLKHRPEHFDKAKINRAIKKLYQEKGDDGFGRTLGGYYDYLEDE